MRYNDSVERYGRFRGQIFLTADPIHLYKVLAAAGTFSLHKSCDGGKEFAIDERFNNLTAIADGIDPAGYFRSIEHAARPKGPRSEQDNGNTNGHSVHQGKVSEIDRIDRRLTVAEEAIKHHAEQSGQG